MKKNKLIAGILIIFYGILSFLVSSGSIETLVAVSSQAYDLLNPIPTTYNWIRNNILKETTTFIPDTFFTYIYPIVMILLGSILLYKSYEEKPK